MVVAVWMPQWPKAPFRDGTITCTSGQSGKTPDGGGPGWVAPTVCFLLPPVALNAVPLRPVNPGFALFRPHVGMLAVVFDDVLKLPHTRAEPSRPQEKS